MDKYTAGRVLAILLGVLCAGITTANLLGGSSAASGVTLEHVNLIGLLFATIAAGLLAKATAASRRWGYAVVFYVIFAACTVMVVYNSVGNQSKTEAASVAAVAGANTSRADLISERDRLDARIAGIRSELARFAGVRSTVEVKAALDTVVGNGPGKVLPSVWRHTKGCAADRISGPVNAESCKPVLDLRVENGKAIEREALRRKLDVAETARASLVHLIGEKKAEQPLPVKAKGFAEALGVLGADEKKVEQVMSRLDKVILALLLELGAIFGIEFGLSGLFAGRPTKAPAPTPIAAEPVTPPRRAHPRRPRTPTIEDAEAARAELVPSDNGDGVTKLAAERDLVTLLAMGRTIDSQDELVERWRMHGRKGTVSKWLSEWERSGIIRRARIGRVNVIDKA